MVGKRLFRSGGVAVFSLTVLVCLVVCLVAEPVLTAVGKGTGSLVGFVFAEDHKTPVADAVVVLRNLDTRNEYASGPTRGDGIYRITGFEGGRYVLGVRAADGGYNLEYTVFLKESTVAKLSVSLEPESNRLGEEPAPVKSGEGKGGSFFKSPVGFLTLVVAAEVAFYALVIKEDEVSPVRR